MLNSKHIFYAMSALIAVLLAAIIGSTYAANNVLKAQSAKLVDYKLQSQVLDAEQRALIDAKKDIEQYAELEQIAKAIVPQDKDQAQAVREIINIASDSGITPTAITFPSSTLGASAGATGGGAATRKSTTSAKAGALSQLTPVKGISGLYNLQITVQLDASNAVPYERFIDFLSRLEQNRRTAQVTSILLQPSTNDRNLVSFTITVDEFIKP